jgi:hypothetical protein
VAAPPPPASPRPPEALPERFESDDFIVAFAREGDTALTLAARYLGDERRAWMIEDYNGRSTFSRGEQVVIPRRDWNISGVEPSGYQIVPILVYHNFGPESKGRLVLAAKAFEEQMRYLKAEGYRVIGLRDFVAFMEQGRQIPRRAVILTFDDGYRAFKDLAYPVPKELGFTATLFVYTDYVGAGRNALTWADSSSSPRRDSMSRRIPRPTAISGASAGSRTRSTAGACRWSWPSLRRSSGAISGASPTSWPIRMAAGTRTS